MSPSKECVSCLLYERLDYIYCDSCRYNNYGEEESIEKYGYYPCENCFRKYMNWEISKEKCDELAEKIIEKLMDENA